MFKNLNIIDRWLLRLHLLCLLGLGLAYFSTQINPEHASILPLFGLLFPVSGFLNILLSFYWTFRKKRWSLLLLLTMVLLPDMHDHWVHIQFKKPKVEGGKLMSYNVRIFDLYEWYNKRDTSKQAMLNILKQEQPEVICFQEFMDRKTDSTSFHWTDTLKQRLNMPYTNLSLAQPLGKSAYYGLATFSKHPIIEKRTLNLSPEGMPFAQITDFKTKKGNIVRLFNVHLASIHFNDEDYRFIKNLKEQENITGGGLKIMNRLLQAFELRGKQVEILKKKIENSPYPTVLAGDFNDSPTSYTYHEFSELLNDAFLVSGFGVGSTYSGDFPSFRIDYIFHSKDIKSANFDIIKDKKLSDHYPISVNLDVFN